MKGMKIDDPRSVELLPAFMQKDEADIALSKAVDELFKDPGSRAEQLRIWDKIDELPEAILDELAWELNIDWYKTSWNITQKRATIKNARLIKSHRGTNYAVEKLIESYLGIAKMYEWWEFNGKPYTFYILVEESVPDQARFDEFVEAVNAGKNARSRLLGIYAYMEHTIVVMAKHEGGAGQFNYLRAGVVPHVMNVGGLGINGAEAENQHQMLNFSYPLAGTGYCGMI